MERGPRFEREPTFERRQPLFSERQRDRESVEYLLSPEGLRDYLANPQNREELVRFWRYMYDLDTFIAARQTAASSTTAADDLRYDLHRTVEEEALPTVVDTSTDDALTTPRTTTPSLPAVLTVGEHMTVTIGKRAITQWPDEQRQSLPLSDGTVVLPSTPVGIIDFYRNISSLGQDGNLVGFARGLIGSAAESLQALAEEYDRRRPQSEALKAFSGMSHLARLAKRFGFTVFDIVNQRQRERATNISRNIATGIAADNTRWQQLVENYKPAQVAIISAEELLRRFNP